MDGAIYSDSRLFAFLVCGLLPKIASHDHAGDTSECLPALRKVLARCLRFVGYDVVENVFRHNLFWILSP